MCMYVCVDAVRPKCNDFMAPAFAVRMVLAYRKAALVMLRAVGLCFRTHPMTRGLPWSAVVSRGLLILLLLLLLL